MTPETEKGSAAVRGEGALIALIALGTPAGMSIIVGNALGLMSSVALRAVAALTFVPSLLLLLKALLLSLKMIVAPDPEDARSAWFGAVAGAALLGVTAFVWFSIAWGLEAG